jgi:NADH-dependent peroxiredoxin subunit F
MNLYDLAIIGGGPAGVAAGIYAARKQLRTVFITDVWGGQSVVSDDIQNWIGTVSISGPKLADDLKKHLKEYADTMVNIREDERVSSVDRDSTGAFIIKTNLGEYNARTVLVTTGSSRRKLTIKGADEFENKGISYCASCDGPLFAGKDAVVVGGGNAGFETAAQLLAYCPTVTLLNRGNELKADPITVKKVLSNPNMKLVMNANPIEISGDKFVSKIKYEDVVTKEVTELKVGGIFVEIGLVPSTDYIKNLVHLNKYGQIITDPRTGATETPGIWAAGDCTDTLYHQNNIAAGDGVRALEDIYLHLHTK